MLIRKAQRGFTLLVAMMVLLVATLLVVGAIAFTGSEMAASGHAFSSEKLSACTQAARNMFLARFPQNAAFAHKGIAQVRFNETIALGPSESLNVRTGHFATTVNIASAEPVIPDLSGNMTQSTDVNDETNMAGSTFGGAGYYRLAATCQDQSTGAEQEVEFYVRLGGT